MHKTCAIYLTCIDNMISKLVYSKNDENETKTTTANKIELKNIIGQMTIPVYGV